jgi:acyl carrier protein
MSDPLLPTTREALAAALLDFVNGPLVKRHNGARRIGRIDADTPLFATGAIDSLGIIDLIAFVESTTGRRIPLRKIDMRFFGTVNRIATNFCRGPEGELS